MAPKKKEYPVDLRQTVIKHIVIQNTKLLTNRLFLELQFIISLISTKKQNAFKILSAEAENVRPLYIFTRAIQRKTKADRRKSASSVKAVIETEFGIIISEQTVRRRLHEAGFKGRVARKKPYVDKTNRMKRIQYAKEISRAASVLPGSSAMD